jgi:hypothetical protein
MAYREFVDSCRTIWAVWYVPASRSERRTHDTWRREEGDRRSQSQSQRLRMRVSAPMSAGWLCFESASEKRRLAPVPSGWQQMSDRGLEELCNSATAVVKTTLEWVGPCSRRLRVTDSTLSGGDPGTRAAGMP